MSGLLRLLVVLSIAKSSIGSAVHINNASAAAPGSHPWLLTLYWDQRMKCGASLIRIPGSLDSSDIALTAAHCMSLESCHGRKELFRDIPFIVYNHTPTWGKGRVKASDGECHESWIGQDSTEGDIAIIKLEKPIQFTDIMKPIDLPEQDFFVKPGSVCTVAGFGATQFEVLEDGSVFSNRYAWHAMEAKVKISSDNEYPCNETDRNMDASICSIIEEGKHPLNADSGGPLECQDDKGRTVLAGIIGHGIRLPKGKVFLASFFTEVRKYVGWINEQITKMSSVAGGDQK